MPTPDYLKGVRLERRMGSFVEPFAFDAIARGKLKRWLNPEQTQQLETAVELALSMQRDRLGEATLGEARAALVRVGELAEALAKLLDMAPGVAEPALLQIARKNLDDALGINRLILSLTNLSMGAADQADRLPAQARRVAHPELISAIAGTVEPLGIAVSDAPKSTFARLAKCVFTSVGIAQDPRGSIRRFLKEKGHDS